MKPAIKKLYTSDELQKKIDQRIRECEWFQKKNNYRLMVLGYYDTARLFELLDDEEKSNHYYQKIVDEWKAHPDKVDEFMCVVA